MEIIISTNFLDGNGSALTTGLDGSIYVGVGTNSISKYRLDGTKDWTKFLGSDNSGGISALTTGLDGSIYVGGYTNSSFDGQTNAGGYDSFIVKYRPDGTKDWTKFLGGDKSDSISALTTGLDGSIYVGGYTNGSFDGQTIAGGNDSFISKYRPDGTKDWTKFWGSNKEDIISALTTGLDGSIYVGGYTNGSFDGQTIAGGSDSFISKYRPDGTKDWTKFWGSNNIDINRTLTTGLDGSIYASGYTYGSFDGQTNAGFTDLFITKYGADGTKDWTKFSGGTSFDSGCALTIGLDGFVYVGGYTLSNAFDGQTNASSVNNSVDAIIIKYATDGTKIGTKFLGGTNLDYCYALTTGLDGSIYASGMTSSNSFSGQNNIGLQSAFLSKLTIDPVIRGITSSQETVTGTSADDIISGGAGKDVLTGGSGNDLFVYNAKTDSTVQAPDTIKDFDSDGDDVIDFSAISGITQVQGLLKAASIKIAPHSVAWTVDKSGNTQVYANNSDVPELQTKADIKISLTGHPTLDAGDFHLFVAS
jgi:hypothetical protein